MDYFHPNSFLSVRVCGPDSDLDFCVVLADDAAERFDKPGARKALDGIGTAMDLVRWTASDFGARAAHVLALLPATILSRGDAAL